MALSSPTSTHIVLLPFPVTGHLNPFLLVARLLARRGVNCTIVLTHDIYNKVMKDEATSGSTFTPGIQLAAISEDLPPASSEHSESTSFLGNLALPSFRLALEVMMRMRSGFEDLVQNLPSRPRCLLADPFVVWSQDSAHKLGLRRVALFTGNASSFSLFFHFRMLSSKGLVPFTDASYKDPQYFIDCIPGLPPLRPIDFSESTRTNPQFALQVSGPFERDEAVLLNTTYELEKDPLDALQTDVPVFPIGPLFLLCDKMPANVVNLWPEETECLNWLDAQPPSSVLYVSFGSMAAMPARQLIELAEGLEGSQQRFLWVIRPNAVMPSESFVLPKDFAERTKDRGLIISWAPQLQVLAHPSLGGFLTHCGWNSIIENVSMGGLPMICWPHGAEQRLNCRIIVDMWKIGIEFSNRKDGIVAKDEVERAVRALMQGEEGPAMKVRAFQLKETVNRAVEKGGSSFRNFETFLESIKTKPLQVL